MKQFSTLFLATTVAFTASCVKQGMSKKIGEGDASGIKSVTINQPDLKKEMKASIKDEDKSKIFATLVYQIMINVQKKDGKDDCADGVTPTSFDSGVVGMDKTTFDAIKVKKSCNYMVSMKIGAKSDDGKAIKTSYLLTSDTSSPSLLSKEELEKSKPNAAVKLYVTPAGKEFWDAELIVTPTDTDTDVDVSLAKPLRLTAAPADVKLDVATGVVTGSVEVTPVAAVKNDQYCASAIRVELGSTTTTTKTVDIFVGPATDRSKSSFKIEANMAVKTPVAGFSGTLPAAHGMTKVNSSTVYMYCNADAAKASAKLVDCFDTPDQQNWPACEDNSIVR